MCDCIEKIQNQLTQLMIEKNPGCEVVDPVEFQNKTWIIQHNMQEILNNPVLGKYKNGKGRVQKFEISMLPTFCAYCGQRIKKTEENDEN
jgi:hypothetical protein